MKCEKCGQEIDKKSDLSNIILDVLKILLVVSLGFIIIKGILSFI